MDSFIHNNIDTIQYSEYITPTEKKNETKYSYDLYIL